MILGKMRLYALAVFALCSAYLFSPDNVLAKNTANRIDRVFPQRTTHTKHEDTHSGYSYLLQQQKSRYSYGLGVTTILAEGGEQLSRRNTLNFQDTTNTTTGEIVGYEDRAIISGRKIATRIFSGTTRADVERFPYIAFQGDGIVVIDYDLDGAFEDLETTVHRSYENKLVNAPNPLAKEFAQSIQQIILETYHKGAASTTTMRQYARIYTSLSNMLANKNPNELMQAPVQTTQDIATDTMLQHMALLQRSAHSDSLHIRTAQGIVVSSIDAFTFQKYTFSIRMQHGYRTNRLRISPYALFGTGNMFLHDVGADGTVDSLTVFARIPSPDGKRPFVTIHGSSAQLNFLQGILGNIWKSYYETGQVYPTLLQQLNTMSVVISDLLQQYVNDAGKTLKDLDNGQNNSNNNSNNKNQKNRRD